MKPNTQLATAFSVAAFVLLLPTMFLPMHQASNGGSEVRTTFWGLEHEYYGAMAGFAYQGFIQSAEWHDDSMDNQDGIEQFRAAGPLMVVGITLAFAGFMVGLLSIHKDLDQLGMLFMMLGTLFSIVALILFENGMDKSDYAPIGTAAGFGVAVAGIIASGLAGLFFLLDLQGPEVAQEVA